MPMVDMRKEPIRPIRGLLPLRAVERYAMPVEQHSSVPGARAESVASSFSSALQSGGFTIVPSSRAPAGEAGPSLVAGRTVFAERNVRRVSTHTGMLVSMGVIVGAAISLGAVDGLLVGGIWYTFPWFLGGLVAAGLLWWRYGRTYESEVISARLSGAGPGGTVTWGAGRVRSVLFSGTRTAVGVIDCPIPLMDGLSKVVRGFEAGLGRPASNSLPAGPEAN